MTKTSASEDGLRIGVWHRVAAAGGIAVAVSVGVVASFAAAVNVNVLVIAGSVAVAAAALAISLWRRRPGTRVLWTSTIVAGVLTVLVILTMVSSHPDFRGVLALPLIVTTLTAVASGVALQRAQRDSL